MIWRNHSNGDLIVLINNVNILSEKANVATEDCFDNILAL
jgi:hypothetical protein